MSSRHAFISVTSKAIAILAIALLVGWMCPARAADVLVEAEDFQFYGIWQRTSAGEASGDFQIQVMGGPKKEPDAITLIELPETGTYNIWVSSRDYTDHEPGERRFRILIDDIPADIESGAHGHDGYYWEKVKTMPLEKGRHVLAANDTTAHYGRFDAIILTTSDANPNTLDERALQKWRIEPITLKTTPPDIFANVPLLVPAGEMEEVARLDNGQVRMIFQKYKDAQGKIQVVRHTELKVGGDWRSLPSKPQEEHLFLIYNPEAEVRFSYWPNWVTQVLTAKVQIGDKVFEMPMRPDNPFFTGDVTPLIPREARKIDDGNVEMIYESPDGLRAVAHWTLEKGRWDAGFGLTLTPEKSGHYSVVYSPFKEWAREEIDFVQLPPVYQFQRIPEYARLVTSSLTPHAMSLIQVAPDEMDNQDVCLAVSAEPKALPFRWPKARNPICGFTLLNQAANVQPTIFMPILGLEGSEWQADQPQRVTWRVLTYPGRWNEALEYYSDTVMGVKDYRSPIYGSLTDAALNMMDLMLDPVASGWDDELKGFYNIEGVGSVTQASPLAMVSAAMLRRDDEIFAKRALPSIEFTLTRVGAHFGLPDARWTTDTLHVPSTFYGTSYWQGLHMLLKGLNPWIADMAFENGDIRHSQDYNESSQWSELLAAWKLRPSDELMQKIIAGADAFIEESFNTRHTEPLDPIKFYNISFYPYWWDLIDLYEMTGDRKYLDAAEEGAFHTVAGQWSQPVVPDGDIEVHPDDQVKGETGILWKNRDRQRLGFPRQPGDTPSKIIPAWQVAQVGLGLEQPTTYFWVTREDAMRHILMSIWAPHLLRVYQHTGREIFRTYARNSAVGRFTNYPGYYMTVFSDLYMRPEYPSEGPDISGIYYHHIPVQLGWTLDYLLEQVFLRSNNHIQFPWVWQKNYAYFVSRVYGAEPGTIYNQKDAELWLDRRLVKIDNPNIDWLAARSPDRFFLILMSQDDEDVDLPLELNADFIGLKKGQGYAYREEGKITAEVLPETPTEINVPARGIVTLSLPAKEGVVFPDLPKVETGHIQVDINPEWGALHVFRVRSPMGKDAIYAALIKGPHDGAKVNVTVKGADQQPPVRERFPYEFSVYPWPLGKPAELEVTIEGPGDFRKSLLVTMP